MCTNLGSFMGLPREVACGSRRMKDAKTREGRALRQVKLPPPVSFYIIQIMRHSHAAKVGRRSGEGQGLLAQVPQWRRLARHRLTHVNTRQDPVRPKCRYCKKAGPDVREQRAHEDRYQSFDSSRDGRARGIRL